MKKRHAALGAALVLILAAPASAHVTIQPNEGIVDTFSRFVVRVPTERDVPTTEITVELPPLAAVSFEPKDGWEREIEMVEIDEPIEAFGQEITEVVGSVTWSGGEIGPGEFDEFGFSASMPADEQTIEFHATQTYEGGEVVEWSGEPDSDTPAALLSLYDIGAGEGEGQVAVLDRVEEASASDEGNDGAEDDDDDSPTAALALGAAGAFFGLVALIVALSRRRA